MQRPAKRDVRGFSLRKAAAAHLEAIADLGLARRDLEHGDELRGAVAELPLLVVAPAIDGAPRARADVIGARRDFVDAAQAGDGPGKLRIAGGAAPELAIFVRAPTAHRAVREDGADVRLAGGEPL